MRYLSLHDALPIFQLVYQRIFYPLSGRTFFSLAELNQAIGELLETYNDYRFHNRTTTRRQQFLEFEQSALDPLPPTRYQLRYYKRSEERRVGKECRARGARRC